MAQDIQLQKHLDAEAAKTGAQIERVNELARTARTTWFSILGFLGFAYVTLFSIKGTDYVSTTQQITLPFAQTNVSILGFAFLGPVLCLAVYVYLHFHLMKLWESISDLDTSDLPSIDQKLAPSLLTDLGLSKFANSDVHKRDLAWLSVRTSELLVFWAAPILLVLFWYQTLQAHNLFLSTLCTTCMAVGVIVSWRSYKRLREFGSEKKRGISGFLTPKRRQLSHYQFTFSMSHGQIVWMRTRATS